MLFSAMRPTEGGITSADVSRRITSSRQRASLPAGGRLASYSALSNPQPATPDPGLLTSLQFRVLLAVGSYTFKDYNLL